MRTLCALLVLSTAAACHSGPSAAETSSCTLANCNLLLSGCNEALFDDADYLWCAINTKSADGGLDNPDALPDGGLLDTCTPTCQAAGDGALIQCIIDQTNQCTSAATMDPGQDRTINANCVKQLRAAGTLPSFSPKCEYQCEETQAHCQAACPLTSGLACEECSMNCAIARGNCLWSCPSAAAHCSDGQLNADETDVDCGGADCSPCDGSVGTKCKTNSDCFTQQCNNGTCSAPTSCRKVGDCPNNSCLQGTCYP